MVQLRAATENDLASLAKIYVKAYAVVNVDEHWTDATSHKLLAYYFHLQPDLAFLAEDNGTPIGGFLSAIKSWWDGNHLIDGELFVDPAYQRRGIGRALLKKVFTEAVEKYDAVIWEASTFRDLDYPLTWYQKLGMSESKEWIPLSGDISQLLTRLE